MSPHLTEYRTRIEQLMRGDAEGESADRIEEEEEGEKEKKKSQYPPGTGQDVRKGMESTAASTDVHMEEVEEPIRRYETNRVRLMDRRRQVRSAGEAQLRDHDIAVEEMRQIQIHVLELATWMRGGFDASEIFSCDRFKEVGSAFDLGQEWTCRHQLLKDSSRDAGSNDRIAHVRTALSTEMLQGSKSVWEDLRKGVEHLEFRFAAHRWQLNRGAPQNPCHSTRYHQVDSGS